jgi:cyclic pyranopterin phosphate synthase
MLSHIDANNQPGMVDVGEKTVSLRTAHAQAKIVAPPELLALLRDDDIHTKKGPVFQTAIVAGIMAAKKTSELIPMCHPIGLDDCKIAIHVNESKEIVIECRAKVHHKTGVEMEALTGATIAALTVYDMCKSVSHGIIIREVKLLEKSGGKSDFRLL